MPQYSYSCHRCGHIEETLLRMDDERPKWLRCTKCGARCLRDIAADHVAGPATTGWPHDSVALALPRADMIPDAVKAYKRAGVNVDFKPDGTLVMKSPGHQRAVMKAVGAVDHDSFY